MLLKRATYTCPAYNTEREKQPWSRLQWWASLPPWWSSLLPVMSAGTGTGSQLREFAAGRRHLPACGASEEGRVHRDGYQVKTRPGLPLRLLSGGTMYPGNDGVLLTGLSNPAHGLDVLPLSNLRGRR